MNKKILWRAVALTATIAFAGSLVSFHARSAGVRGEVLRLHVIANSDCDVDQQAKLHVRDALLAQGDALFYASGDIAQAEQAVALRTAELEHTAQQALRELGLHQSVRVSVGTAFFNTRSYGALTFPAGRYQAVQVHIGDSVGENWWCVMFPPLCLPAATTRESVTLDAVLSDGEMRVVESNPQFDVRFRIVELVQELLERLRGE
ncbi:MAG: stage II sporulation protein R [Oscillospiraceae bacterium]|nr:stage II sporulation protein R [Oscillospiraceae bacterium]